MKICKANKKNKVMYMSDLKVTVNARSENATKTIAQARGFTLVIDEPDTFGGLDEGANPVEYLLASLTGCLGVVCNMVAKEMNFELKGLDIEVEGDLNPKKLMGLSDRERAGFKEIRVKLTPHADADAKTLKEWLETVESRCPISDNIANPTPVSITLA